MRAFRRGIIWLDGWWLAPLLYLLELSVNLCEVSQGHPLVKYSCLPKDAFKKYLKCMLPCANSLSSTQAISGTNMCITAPSV